MITPLIAHNYYQQPGGEDQVVLAETDLLKAYGHRVTRFTLHNDEVDHLSKLSLGVNAIWNKISYKNLRTLIHREGIEVVHFHNTLPLLSPSAYYAAKREGAAVVQTLHNYRLLCPGSLFYRDETVCELCLHKSVAWPAVIHACYRQSRAATGVVATMLATHRLVRTYIDKVDLYIALTEFARQKFIAGGLPEEKVVVKPNFLLNDPGFEPSNGDYLLFVGRLAPEKGIDVLLKAWKLLQGRTKLKIVGDGPLSDFVAEECQKLKGVEWLGRQQRPEVVSLMKNAYGLVFPSTWYEGLPMTIIEAYAVGLPVIASNLGSMSTLIHHEKTGLHFQPSRPEALAEQINWALDHPGEMQRMRREARTEYETQYTAERNYNMLIDVYEKAMQNARNAKTALL